MAQSDQLISTPGPTPGKIEAPVSQAVSEGEHSLNNQLAIKKWLPFITLEASFATVFVVFTGGAFLTGLALMLGANDFEIGLLAAIPFLAQVAQLFSAYLTDRTGKRKAIAVWSIFVSRQICWILLAVFLLPSSWRLQVLIGVVILSNFTTMIAAPGWLAWMAELVPEKIRGRYFGSRSAAVAIATVSATLIGGVIIDRFRLLNREDLGFGLIIGLACLFALVAWVLMKKLPDRPAESLRLSFDFNHLVEPLKNPSYAKLLGVFFVWNMAIGISAAFFVPHMLNNLKMNFTMISLYSSAAALIAVILNKPWGILIDRFGSRPVLVFCAFGIAVVPLIWLFPRQDFLWILAFESIYSGGLWTGFNLAAFNIPIANSPREGRTMYLAMFAVITGLGFFLASIAGGIIAQLLSSVHWHIGPQTIVNYHILFAISGIVRLLAALLVMTFHEPTEKGLPIMVQFMGYAVLKWLSVGRQIHPWYRRVASGR